MPAGTIALTNNSATITGTGTSFTTELKVNDFLVSTVGGLAYTLGVKSIQSNTSLTLMEVYTGPSASGQSWTPVPYGTMASITAQVAAQVTYAIRGFNLDKANWQQIFTGTGTVTVTLPDGTSWQGPAWGGIGTTLANKAAKGANSDITSLSGLTTALSPEQGGTGQKTAGNGWKALLDGRTPTIARTDLQLTSAATSTVQASTTDSTAGALLINGAWGLGGGGVASITWGDAARQQRSSFVSNSTDSPIANTLFMGINCSHGVDAAFAAQFAARGALGAYWRTRESTNFNAWRKIYDDGNTTKASDGTLKAASPVARIVCSRENSQRTDVAETGFSWCGCGTSNEEAEGITLSRLEAGVYILTGSAGLATEGWQLLPPRDPMGSGDLGIVEAEQTVSGGLTIKLYKRRYIMTDDGEIVADKGALIDVPANSWIDVRLDMPEDSAYNRNQAGLQSSALEDEQQAGS